MRGSTLAASTYSLSPSVDEKVQVVLELNANAGITYDYVGHYPSTANNSYAESAGTVTGAKFTTRYVKTFSPIIAGMEETDIEALRYIDEPDALYGEMFPIESIVGLDRPGPGIVKLTGDDNLAPIPSPYCRVYSCESKSEYRYWKSSPPSGGVWNSSPFVKYSRSFWANKIKVSLETHKDFNGVDRAIPVAYEVQVLPGNVASTGTWTTVYSGTGSNWPAGGTLKIYYYDGAWTTVPSLTDIHEFDADVINNAVKIFGVRVKVTTGPVNAGLSFIELSPRLALNVTSAATDISSSENLAEDDSALLVGSISSNESDVTVENYTGLFNFDVPTSVMYGHQPKKAGLDIYSSVEVSPGNYETNRISYGLVDSAPKNDDETLTIKAYDGMKRLQSVDVKGMLLQNYKVSEVVRTLLDWAGVSDMTFNYEAIEDDLTIQYFYSNNETVYSALNDIAEAYQMAMCFDSDNVFQLYTKEYLLSSTRPVKANLNFADSPTRGLANIIKAKVTEGKPVNDITISYKPHYIETAIKGIDRGDPSTGRPVKPLWWQRREPKVETVWEAPSMTLGAAALVETISPSSTEIYIDQESGLNFNYSGYLMVDQEVIAYSAMEYFYKPYSGSTYVTVWISSREEFVTLQETMYPGSRLYFTGRLKVAENGRGRFQTVAATHKVDTARSNPYTSSSAWRVWKTCPHISSVTPLPKYSDGTLYGSQIWRFGSGGGTNVRGAKNDPSSIIRRGSNSAVRLNGADKDDIDGRNGATSVWNSLVHSAVWYLDLVSNDIVPRRVGSGLALIGKSSGGAPYRPEARAGVGMWMWNRSDAPGFRLNGWTVEVEASTETIDADGKQLGNVRIFQVIDDVFYNKAEGTANIPVMSHTVVPPTMQNDSYYTHVELAYYDNYQYGRARFVAYVNGRAICSYEVADPGAIKKTGSHGPYVRSRTMADFDYTWWSTRSDPMVVDGYTADSPVDWTKFSIHDAVLSAAGPPIWWAEGSKQLFGDDLATKSLNYRSETMGLAEFGPMAHEVEIIRTDFDSAPIINAQAVGSFGSMAKIPVFQATPFGAEMVIVNARRHTVVLGDNAKVSVKGYAVKTLDEKYTFDDLAFSGDDQAEILRAKNKASKAIHGSIPIEISSELIQSKRAAKSLMKWISTHQALDCDIIELTIFGNPLLEAGDIVSIDYPELGLLPTTKYLVVSSSNSFDSGFATELKVRMI